MNQLTKTNNNNFELNDSLIEKFLSSAGRELIVLKYDGYNWYNRKQLAEVYGYKQPSRKMFVNMDKEDFHYITLCKDKLIYRNSILGLRDVIKLLGESGRSFLTPKTNFSVWVREDTLIKFSQRANLEQMGGDGQKILDILLADQKPEKKVEKKENSLQQLLRSEVEALQLGSEFRKWYLDKVEQSPYLKRMNYKRRSPNWLLCLMGFYNSLSSRFVVALGKNSAKKRLKKKGASSRMLNSNRAIIRSQHPPSGDYWTLIVSEYMRHVDSIMFLPILTIKSTSIQFAERKDSSSYINSSCLI